MTVEVNDLIEELNQYRGKKIDFVIADQDDNYDASCFINDLSRTHTDKKYHNTIEIVLEKEVL